MAPAGPEAKALRYWWADGVYFNVRLDDEPTCALVLIGATEDGTNELIALVDGYRETPNPGVNYFQQLNRLGLYSKEDWKTRH